MRRLTIIATLFAAVLSTSVFADDGGRHGNNGQNNQNSFSSSLVGSTPGVMVGGIASGGAPWVVSQGSASIDSNGRLQVNVSGLLFGPGAPANLLGTVGPVQMVAASLVCGGSGGMVVASTTGVFLNASGNARIDDTIAVPASCTAPAILIRIFSPGVITGSPLGAFIAITGIAPGANPGNGNRDHED